MGGMPGARYKITHDGEIVESGHTQAPGLSPDTDQVFLPGGVKDHVRNINEGFLAAKFQKAGKYTLQISLPTDRPSDGDPWTPDPKMNIISNIIEFEILPNPSDTSPEQKRGAVRDRWREALLSGKQKQMDQARKEILDHRAETINMLIEIIKDKNLQETNRPAVVAAAKILGDLRAKEAIPALLEIILLSEDGWYKDSNETMSLPLDRRTYASDALVKIGLPALKPVTERLLSRNKSLVNPTNTGTICYYIIEYLLGYRLAEQYFVQTAKEYPQDSEEYRILQNLTKREHSLIEDANKGIIPMQLPGQEPYYEDSSPAEPEYEQPDAAYPSDSATPPASGGSAPPSDTG